MSKKNGNIVIIVVIGVIVVLAFLLIALLGKKDSYRIVKIYEYDGKATVTRQEDKLEPYNNMLLESGDGVYLDTGKMTLKMDEDKYAYVEEKTQFSIRAEGKNEDGKTTITINKGSITNEIQNKLSSDSTYEVNTPNATMAVRGTVFRVSTYYDENDVCYTKVSVFDGEVVSRLVYGDGTVSEEEVSISSGKEVVIYADNKTTDYLTEVTEIDYIDLPNAVIELIKHILGDKANIPIMEDTTQTEGTVEGEKQEMYVITFLYNGKTFATQQVKEGDCVTIPSLMPAAMGDWDFDFTTPITEDMSITWKE